MFVDGNWDTMSALDVVTEPGNKMINLSAINENVPDTTCKLLLGTSTCSSQTCVEHDDLGMHIDGNDVLLGNQSSCHALNACNMLTSTGTDNIFVYDYMEWNWNKIETLDIELVLQHHELLVIHMVIPMVSCTFRK